MTTIPTPAEFLASIEPDEDFDQPPHAIDHPLYLIAQSLQRMADAHGAPDPAVLETAACTECASHQTNYLQADAERQSLTSEVMGLAERAARAEGLIEQIESIVKKSTSKVSLEVKAAIEAWRTPAAAPSTETPSPAPDASPSEPAVDDAAAVPGSPLQDVQQARVGEGLPPGHGQALPPAPDAPVEEWRAYARSVHGTPEGSSTVLDQMNRSQIRSMLGIEQPVTPAGA